MLLLLTDSLLLLFLTLTIGDIARNGLEKAFRVEIGRDLLGIFLLGLMRSGVKLYVADSCHNCMYAGLPCMVYSFGEIEMRGNRIDQGFRMVRDTVKVAPLFIP